jgi:hypothetical protein
MVFGFSTVFRIEQSRKIKFNMLELKKFLSKKDVTVLFGYDSELGMDCDIEEPTDYLDDDDLPIEYSLESLFPSQKTAIQ